MPGLNVYRSPRLEELADRLGESLRAQECGPFEVHSVWVQSSPIGNWLRHRLALEHGVVAGVDFPFLNEALWALLGESEGAKWEEGRGVWRIASILRSRLRDPLWEELATHVRVNVEKRLLPTSRELALQFNLARWFRPDLVQKWREEISWQGQLWRALAEELSESPPSERLTQLMSEEAGWPELPACLRMVVVNGLPPLMWRMIWLMARRCKVELYLFSPSNVYLGESEDPRLHPGEDAVLHALLFQYARLFGETTDLLLEVEQELGPLMQEEELPMPQWPDSQLGSLQSSLVEGLSTSKSELVLADGSVVVHCCATPLREVQVLRDALRSAWKTDPTLRPRDVLVFVQDLDLYAPLINAVFGQDETHKIPFRIADRVSARDIPVESAFLKLLTLGAIQCSARELLEWASQDFVSRRLKLEKRDLELLGQWFLRAGFASGIEENESCSLQEWRKRLMLSMATKGVLGMPFAGVYALEFDPSEERDALVGALTMVELVVRTADLQGLQLSLHEWSDRFSAVLEDLLRHATSEEIAASMRLRRHLAAFCEWTSEECFSLSQVLQFLTVTLEAGESQGGFFSGGVTFCAMRPMRAVPFRWIGVLGLDEGKFPRRDPVVPVNLMGERRPGDPSARRDDQALFLQILLAARQHLHLSCIGRSAVSDALLPPSLVVISLLSELSERPQDSGHQLISPIHEHAEESFMAHPVHGHRWNSSSQSAFLAAQILADGPVGREKVARPVARLGLLREGRLSISSVLDAWSDPLRWFVRRRLGVAWDDWLDELLEDGTPAPAVELNARKYMRWALTRLEQGANWPDEEAQALGLLSHGVFGQTQAWDWRFRVEQLWSALPESWRAEPNHGDVLVEVLLRSGERRLQVAGPLPRPHQEILARALAKKTSVRDLVRCWLQAHLLLAGGHTVRRATLIFQDQTCSWAITDEPDKALQPWVHFWFSLQDSLPPFLPSASWNYLERKLKGRDKSKDGEQGAWGSLKGRFEPAIGRHVPDETARLTEFLGLDWMDQGLPEGFVDHAETLLGPILETMEVSQ